MKTGKLLIEISVDYKILGVKKHSMQVYSGGFVWTNVAKYGLYICVGEESVNRFISQVADY